MKKKFYLAPSLQGKRLRPANMLNEKFRLAHSLHLKGDILGAQRGYEEVLLKNPKHFDALHLLGVTFIETNPHKAIELICSAIEINSKVAASFVNASNAMIKVGEFAMAINCCNQAIALDPENSKAHHNMGTCFVELGKPIDALNTLNNPVLLALDEDHAVHLSKGAAYELLYEFDKALSCYARALEIDPNNVKSLSNIANVFMQLGHFEKALSCYEKAKSIDPGYADNRSNLSLCYLIMGNFADGWKEYSWRLKKKKPDFKPYITSKPLLDQADLHKRILVLGEQGVGDIVFFGRLLSELKNFAEEVVARVDYRLIKLLQRSMPNIHFIPEGLTISEDLYDGYIFLGDLPRYFRSTKESFSGLSRSYLSPDKDRASRIRHELCSESDLLVGISWKSKNITVGEKRSLDLNAFATALNIPGIKLVNLQYGDVRDQISTVKSETGVEVLQCSSVDNTNDLDGLASLIEACDLVISADNTTVHIAGSIGKETWICIPAIPNWRWMVDTNNSPWYPSVKLFRQLNLGDWTDVLENLRTGCLKRLEFVG